MATFWDNATYFQFMGKVYTYNANFRKMKSTDFYIPIQRKYKTFFKKKIYHKCNRTNVFESTLKPKYF